MPPAAQDGPDRHPLPPASQLPAHCLCLQRSFRYEPQIPDPLTQTPQIPNAITVLSPGEAPCSPGLSVSAWALDPSPAHVVGFPCNAGLPDGPHISVAPSKCPLLSRRAPRPLPSFRSSFFHLVPWNLEALVEPPRRFLKSLQTTP